jgi:hypothetical protein
VLAKSIMAVLEEKHVMNCREGWRQKKMWKDLYQWVYRDINKMKAHQSHEQFINLIQEVVKYCL